MAVVIAFLANIAVAIAKTAAAVLTGSASLVAEALHSWADAGNEVFLLLAERSGRRERDRAHPLGFGRDVYFWSLFAAFRFAGAPQPPEQRPRRARAPDGGSGR